jgi:BirA family biotin operon repressor/biotin-[acetyl-CoA-carboxylase] ligase
VPARLKWPNDVLLAVAGGLRKVAGILTEMASERDRVRHVVVGVGINVNGTDFPPSWPSGPPRCCSRQAPLRSGHPARGVARRPRAGLRAVRARGARAALDRWRQHADLGRRCRVERDGAVIEGVAEDVDAEGTLLVRDDSGHLHRVLSGEISL